MMDGVTVKDRGLLQLFAADKVYLIYAESGVDRNASRGFVHRHGIMADVREYEGLGGHPRVFQDSFLTYEQFRSRYGRRSDLDPIRIKSNLREVISGQELGAVQTRVSLESLKDLLNALVSDRGRASLYYAGLDFDDLRLLSFGILALLPTPIRTRIPTGIAMTLKQLDLKLSTLEGDAHNRIVSSSEQLKVVDDVASIPFQSKDIGRVNGRLALIHQEFNDGFAGLLKSQSREDALVATLHAYERDDFRRDALRRALSKRLIEVETMIDHGEYVEARRELSSTMADLDFESMTEVARDQVQVIYDAITRKKEELDLSQLVREVEEGNFGAAEELLSQLRIRPPLNEEAKVEVDLYGRVVSAAKAVSNSDYNSFAAVISNLSEIESDELVERLGQIRTLSLRNLALLVLEYSNERGKTGLLTRILRLPEGRREVSKLASDPSVRLKLGLRTTVLSVVAKQTGNLAVLQEALLEETRRDTSLILEGVYQNSALGVLLSMRDRTINRAIAALWKLILAEYLDAVNQNIESVIRRRKLGIHNGEMDNAGAKETLIKLVRSELPASMALAAKAVADRELESKMNRFRRNTEKLLSISLGEPRHD